MVEVHVYYIVDSFSPQVPIDRNLLFFKYAYALYMSLSVAVHVEPFFFSHKDLLIIQYREEGL